MRLGGVTIGATARLCEIGERTVWAAARSYEIGGWAAVSVRHGHRPKGTGRALTPEQERAEIHWGNEAGLRSDDVRGRSYAPKGEAPVLQSKSNRSSLSGISTVTNRGQIRWRIFSGALDASILIDLLKRLTRNGPKKIFLIFDNLRVHHAKVVQQWVRGNTEMIEVLYVPSYSPELNSCVLLNADLKQRVTAAIPSKTKVQPVKTTSKALRSIQKQPTRVERYLHYSDVTYAA
jgi:hypothetical protein